MKTRLLVSLFAMSVTAGAQGAHGIYRQACGLNNVKFHVKMVNGQPPAAPEAGKALVYFVQKKYGAGLLARIGLDGTWVGALKGNSYIALSIAPGEHRACASLQYPRASREDGEFLRIAVEAGKVYYYQVRNVETAAPVDGGVDTVEFAPAEVDEALFQIAADPQSVARPEPPTRTKQ
ncbi:MAG: DUF2846 domain-containing protein [Terriglobia bacterium]